MNPILVNGLGLKLYERMTLIRKSEERLGKLFAEGAIPGFVHLSIGQEAVPVGVMDALREHDTVASTHRGHGHTLARGVDLRAFFAEILGREAGLCKGRGGSMHVANLASGFLGANGIVGAGISIALGSALAHQLRATGAIGVAFFGDGAMAEGVLHESLNLASLWKLPLLCVCENNGWSEFSMTRNQFVASLQDLSAAFHISFESVDGNDVMAVREATFRLAEAARSGMGPQVLECRTMRWRGHYEGDPQKYRPSDELATVSANDPVSIFAAKLAEFGIDTEQLLRAAERVEAEIDAAIATAQAAREPTVASLSAASYTRPAHA